MPVQPDPTHPKFLEGDDVLKPPTGVDDDVQGHLAAAVPDDNQAEGLAAAVPGDNEAEGLAAAVPEEDDGKDSVLSS